MNPWPRPRLDLHVTQSIREQLGISTMILLDVDDNGNPIPYLRENGEEALWRVVQKAIAEAGWQLSHTTDDTIA